jgi:hypothetical protein
VSVVLACRGAPAPRPGGPGVRTAVTARPALRCLHSATEALPPDATRWVFVRPADIFQHPRLGPALARAIDDAGDQALFARARRHGYDLRTLPRAALAWRGDARLAVGLGSLDTARITALLWDRLLTPRDRHDLGDGAAHMTGVLGTARVGLAVHGRCGVAAWSEGDARWALRALPVGRAETEGGASETDDPASLLHWEQTGVPDGLADEARADAALSQSVRRFVLDVQATPSGLALTLRLHGPLPDDAAARVEAALARFRQSDLGGAIGADVWLAGAHRPRVAVDTEPTSTRALALTAAVPWSGVEALADVMRGRVGP